MYVWFIIFINKYLFIFPSGSASEVYHYLNCSVGPEGNIHRSYLTMLSNPGLMFGVINIVGKLSLF